MVARRAGWPRAAPVPRSLGRRVADAYAAWLARTRSRRELQSVAELDHRTLADIGWPADLRRD